ncbi:MAG: phage Gp37/Gp68 family protein [Spirochaetaceae bacterium]|nr:phage Gp37/Gp68 family protein [Spirochaetaceae bacterium]
MNKTKIEWCDYTWSPVTGCLHNCPYCYARKIANRFKRSDFISFPLGFIPTFYYRRLREPQKIKKPQNTFVCSMADLFGEWVPDEWICKVFEACKKAPQHRYLFLTKNPKRYIAFAKAGELPREHWYGWTVTDKSNTHRNSLYPEYNTFVSFEPLLDDPCYFYNSDKLIGWAIIGAETGNRKNKIIPKREWIETIIANCREHNIPIFMKNNLQDIWQDTLIQELPLAGGI